MRIYERDARDNIVSNKTSLRLTFESYLPTVVITYTLLGKKTPSHVKRTSQDESGYAGKEDCAKIER